MAAFPEEILYQGECRYPGCSTVWVICRPCYRGQRYCWKGCSGLARLEKKREYNRRHQQTETGREDHRDRQEAYRRRLAELGNGRPPRENVTDQSRPEPTADDKLPRAGGKQIPPLPGGCVLAQSAPQEGSRPPLSRCGICGRHSVLVEPVSESKRIAELLRRKAVRDSNELSGPDYLKAILDPYVSLPETACRRRRDNRELAQQLHRQGIPRFEVEAALLVATARHVLGNELEPRQPIRSLRDLVPLFTEVRRSRVGEGYVHYLRQKLRHLPEPNAPASVCRRIRAP